MLTDFSDSSSFGGVVFRSPSGPIAVTASKKRHTINATRVKIVCLQFKNICFFTVPAAGQSAAVFAAISDHSEGRSLFPGNDQPSVRLRQFCRPFPFGHGSECLQFRG